MEISSQQPQSSQELKGLFGKKNKKESVFDALMKLVEPTTKEGKKGKNVFSLGENPTDVQTTKKESPLAKEIKKEKEQEKSEIPTKISEFDSFKSAKTSLSKRDQPMENITKEKTDIKINHKNKKMDSIEKITEIAPEKLEVFMIYPPKNELVHTTPTQNKKDPLPQIETNFNEFSNQTKTPTTLLEIKQEQQIYILKDLAKQLSEAVNTKQDAFSTAEVGKTKTTFIQLPLHESNNNKSVEAKKMTDHLSVKTEDTTKEVKKIKEVEGVKTETISVEQKVEASPRTETTKTEPLREIKNLITQEIEQYVEFKEVNSKKVTLSIQHEELGNLELHVEKKDDKIYIQLKVDITIDKEKMEETMEQLKDELKEKNIEVEYEVEQEEQQSEQHKEKRKEQEQMTEKENRREKSVEEKDRVLKFDELLEVGF